MANLYNGIYFIICLKEPFGDPGIIFLYGKWLALLICHLFQVYIPNPDDISSYLSTLATWGLGLLCSFNRENPKYNFSLNR